MSLNENAVLEVTARPVEPRGNLFGFASVKIGGVTVHDFKIIAKKDGELFVGMPSKPSEKSKTGYRNTVYVDKEYLEDFSNAILEEYHAAVERGQDRIAEKPRMSEQMAEAAKHAAEHNATKPVPAKDGKAKDAEL